MSQRWHGNAKEGKDDHSTMGWSTIYIHANGTTERMKGKNCVTHFRDTMMPKENKERNEGGRNVIT